MAMIAEMKKSILVVFSMIAFHGHAYAACPESYRQGNDRNERSYVELFDRLTKGRQPNRYFGMIQGEPEFHYPYRFLDWRRFTNAIDSLQGRRWETWLDSDWRVVIKEIEDERQILLSDGFVRQLDASSRSEVFANIENQIKGIECYASLGANPGVKQGSTAAGQNPSSAPPSSEARSKSAKSLDERQEAAFQRIVQQGRDADDADYAQRGKAQRHKIVIETRPECLRVVDVSEDRTVKHMYWYAIQNICDVPVHAFWCAGPRSECRKSKQAWLLAPGSKERSWMGSAVGSKAVEFYGTACVDKFEGRQVYFDKSSSRCWTWGTD